MQKVWNSSGIGAVQKSFSPLIIVIITLNQGEITPDVIASKLHQYGNYHT